MHSPRATHRVIADGSDQSFVVSVLQRYLPGGSHIELEIDGESCYERVGSEPGDESGLRSRRMCVGNNLYHNVKQHSGSAE
jgi:hypothetical protein